MESFISEEELHDLSRKIESRRSGVRKLDPVRYEGQVAKVVGLMIESRGPKACVGELCMIQGEVGGELPAEVVGFRDNSVLLMPLGRSLGVGPGSKVLALGRSLRVPVGMSLKGRVLDGLGRPADGRPLEDIAEYVSVESKPPHPLARRRIMEPLSLGIRAIDGLLTCGKGQRMGIFSGSGVGKSTLLGMLARYTKAHVNVIALVGERGREVKEFITNDLGEEGLERSVVVAATSDEPAMIRIKAALVATSIAEYFRNRGLDVLFMLDSITRFSMAQREVGLTAGEPPATRGYPPSVFAMMPQLMERAGCSEKGTITALYTVLVEGDDMNEPIGDTARSILDGHIVLSRDLASRNHYPAIDVLASVSRLASAISESEQLRAAAWLRKMLAVYREAEDLINIGAYKGGTSREIDEAIEHMGGINEYLRQAVEDGTSYRESATGLVDLARVAGAL